MVASISSHELFGALDPVERPLILDVRRGDAWRAADAALPWSLRRDPAGIASWQGTLELGRPVVAYCMHGHEVSQGIAAALAAIGLSARYLEGGIAGWRDAGLPVESRRDTPSQWVTRARPKIDRIACPWLIRRFVDADANFLYVPVEDVAQTASQSGATPFDVEGVAFSHDGERCSFDAFLARYRLDDPALAALAVMVRGADTGRPELAPQAAGLLAISLGLSARFDDDQEMLRYGLVVYDALYAWLRKARDEAHGWPPSASHPAPASAS